MTEEHGMSKTSTWALDSVSLDYLLHRKPITGPFFPQKLPRVTIVFAPPHPLPFCSLLLSILQLPSLFSGAATYISNISTAQISDLAPFCRITVHSGKVSPVGKPGRSILCITSCVFLPSRFTFLSCLMFNAWKLLLYVFFPVVLLFSSKGQFRNQLTCHSQKCPSIL